jgi:hypothetical protein
MRTLTTIPVSPVGFDRISTTEELKQVVELLLEMNSPDEAETLVSSDTIEVEVAPHQLARCLDENSRAVDAREIATLLLDIPERTN